MTSDNSMDPLKPLQMSDFKDIRTPARPWWPEEFGSSPDASGAQDAVRFAYFANALRLLIKRGDEIATYNTRGHVIRGFALDARGGLLITTDEGELGLDNLRRL